MLLFLSFYFENLFCFCVKYILYIVDDFKPASIDHSQEAELVVGAKGEVNITIPNDQVSRMGRGARILQYRTNIA